MTIQEEAIAKHKEDHHKRSVEYLARQFEKIVSIQKDLATAQKQFEDFKEDNWLEPQTNWYTTTIPAVR